MNYNTSSENELISECLSGQKEPDCEYCPAHSSQGGKCCFGFYDPKDQQCTECVLNYQCGQEGDSFYGSTYQTESRRDYSRPPSREYSVLPVVGQSRRPKSAFNRPTSNQTQRVSEESVPNEPVKLPETDNNALKFSKMVAWGAGEGMLRMALYFMSSRRPE